MTLPIAQWYDGYVPTAADFKDFASRVAPASVLGDAFAYTDAQVAQAKNAVINAASAMDVITAPSSGGTVAVTRPDITKLTTVSVDIAGNLAVTGATLLSGPVTFDGYVSMHDVAVGGVLTVAGQSSFTQAVGMSSTLLVSGKLLTTGGFRLNGIGPYATKAAAAADGHTTGEVFYNTTLGGLDLVL